MKTLLRIIGGLVLLGIVALIAFIFVPVQRTAPAEMLAADWKPEPGQGEYVMHASDCVACHTAPGGEPMAGGRPIESPMGMIWSTNITPDKETGIGNWSLDDFRAAMIDGVTPNGTHLYPAMPYENYRLMSEADIRALYEYMMTEITPVKNENKETALSFPFNMRFGIRAWNWLALNQDAGFAPVGVSAVQDRGQYLVEGPAHCAACHSPRNIFMAQDGTQATDANFLSGGVVAGWNAPSLRGPQSAAQKWTVEEMAAYLATGRNAHSTANGEMGLVVQHSLQHLTDADNLAIAAFLKGIDGAKVEVEASADFAPKQVLALREEKADDAGKATETLLTEQKADMPLGARLYVDNCIACHFASGKGAPGMFPEMQDNNIVTGSEVGPLISVILHGAKVEGTKKRPMDLVMQGYEDRLSDEETAELVNFLRTGWGHNASTVTAADVANVRAKGAPTH